MLFSGLNSWVSFWTWSVKAEYEQSSFVVPTIIFQKIKVDDASLKKNPLIISRKFCTHFAGPFLLSSSPSKINRMNE